MSDKNKEEYPLKEDWKPLDLASLQHIENERSMKIDSTSPDYNLFKRIYEDTEIAGSEVFKPLYEFGHDDDMDRDDGFKPSGGAISEFRPDRDHGAGHHKTAIKKDKPVNSSSSDDADNLDGGLCDTMESDSESEKDINRGFDEGFKRGKQEGFKEGRAQGENQGYIEGYKKGDNEAKKDCDLKSSEILSSIEDILVKTDDAWTGLVKKYENEIISLVCKIAGKVVLARVDIDDKIVKESIFYALEKMPEPEEITLYVSPDDYEYIEMIKDDFFEKIKGLTSVSVLSDPSVNRGGCRIESSKAKIQTDIESRLEAVFSSVVKAGVL